MSVNVVDKIDCWSLIVFGCDILHIRFQPCLFYSLIYVAVLALQYILSLSGQNLVSSINQILQEKQKTSLRTRC